MPDLSPVDIAWLAGLLEGEGCFDLMKVCPRVRLTMCDLDVLIKAADLLGCHRVINFSRKTGRENNLNPAYYTALHGEPAINIMKIIRPLMGERRGKKIDEILASWDKRQRIGGRHWQAKKTGPYLSSQRGVWLNPRSEKQEVCHS